MKLFYLTLVLVFSQAAHAQLYQTSIGLKGGFPGYGSLNSKYFLSKNIAIEGSIGGNQNGIILQGLYEINAPLSTSGLSWYYGGGAYIGSYSNSGMLLGVTGVLGIEYRFEDFPLNIALDSGPALNFIPTTKFNWGGGLAARYILK